jgi:multisubunit Na+/H+ antiporter MnhG subunit
MRRARRSAEDLYKRQEEARKARIRGLRYTLLGFLSALVVMVGAKVRHPKISLKSPMMVLGALVLGTFLMIAIASRRDE